MCRVVSLSLLARCLRALSSTDRRVRLQSGINQQHLAVLESDESKRPALDGSFGRSFISTNEQQARRDKTGECSGSCRPGEARRGEERTLINLREGAPWARFMFSSFVRSSLATPSPTDTNAHTHTHTLKRKVSHSERQANL